MKEREQEGYTVIIFLSGSRKLRRRNEHTIRKKQINAIFRMGSLDEFLMEQMKDI